MHFDAFFWKCSCLHLISIDRPVGFHRGQISRVFNVQSDALKIKAKRVILRLFVISLRLGREKKELSVI